MLMAVLMKLEVPSSMKKTESMQVGVATMVRSRNPFGHWAKKDLANSVILAVDMAILHAIVRSMAKAKEREAHGSIKDQPKDLGKV